MSTSVSLSIVTNTAIAASKGFGWLVTGSPTLFAETIHSVADVANQILLSVGEVRGRGGPDPRHPFGRGQETFFWALVSAVSVFFVGCGVNVYHGVHALLSPAAVEPFTPLVLALLLFALALESLTFVVAVREIGGWKGLLANRANTTVLAVVLEDAVALLGILLTLLVAGVSLAAVRSPRSTPSVAIVVGVMLGAMALFLAALNRRLLIDSHRPRARSAAAEFLAARGIPAAVSSIVLDAERSVVFVRVAGRTERRSRGRVVRAGRGAQGARPMPGTARRSRRSTGSFRPRLPRSGAPRRSDRAGRVQRGNIRIGVAQLAQNRVGVLAQRGYRIHAIVKRVACARRQQRRQRPHGRSDRGPARARRELRMRPQLLHRVHARIGDLRRLEAGDELARGQGRGTRRG